MVEALLAPADALRAAVYRWLGPLLGGLYADRVRRVPLLGTALIALAFGLTVASPLWLLAVGPLVLGVPHLLADFRYLVVQPGLHRRGALCALAALPLVAVGLGATAAVGLLAVAVAVLGATASWRRKALGLAAWAALTLAALWAEGDFVLVFLHAHNLVALGLWWRLRPRGAVAAWPLVAVVAGTGLLLSGAMDGALTALGSWSAPASGLSFTELAATSAPLADPTLAARLVLSFAFLQSVHYVVWLRLIPEDARERPAPRPFLASFRALVRDFGLAPLCVCAAVALGIAAWGALDVAAARMGYLRLATFHGYLELAVGALLVLEGRQQPRAS